MATALGGELGVEAEVDEGVAMRVGDQEHRAALAAVAAIRPAARDELLAAEAQAAAAAVTGLDVDVGFVDEHVRWSPGRREGHGHHGAAGGSPCGAPPRRRDWRVARGPWDLFGREDRDEPAPRAVVLELHRAGDLGKQRVVLAEADVEAGLVLAAALADEDRPAGDEVAVGPLDAEPLRVRVAPLSRAALSLFDAMVLRLMSVMRTRVRRLRCPWVRRTLRRFFLKTRTFLPLSVRSITPTTLAPSTKGVPVSTSPASLPTSSTWSNDTVAPASPVWPSTAMMAPGSTRNWWPEALIIANTVVLRLKVGAPAIYAAGRRNPNYTTGLGARGRNRDQVPGPPCAVLLP